MKAIGIPTEMFTAIFAVGRTVGWISHWHEMVTEGLKLAVHASFYIGAPHANTQREISVNH